MILSSPLAHEIGPSEWYVASRTATAASQPNRLTIAIKNEALPHGKIRKTTNSTAAATETSAVAVVSLAASALFVLFLLLPCGAPAVV